VFIEFGLGGTDGGIEVVIVQRWIDDFVASVPQASRFDTADYAVPAVEEEDFHAVIFRPSELASA